MYLTKLLESYTKYFGFISSLYNSILLNKLISLPLIGIVGSAIYFLVCVFEGDNIGIVVSSILFAISTYIAGFLIRRAINKRFGSTANFFAVRLEKFSNVIYYDLKCINLEQIHFIEEMIDNRLELEKEIKKYPFANTINVLFTGVLITGLLSYSFNALQNGNHQLAIPLLTIYLSILGLIIILSSVLYNTKEFTQRYKFLHIKVILSELKIKMTDKNIHN